MPFVIKFKNQDLINLKDDLNNNLREKLKEAIAGLAQMTLAKATDLADQKLGSRKQMFKDNLSLEQVSDNLWVVSLAKPAVWINDGVKGPYDMRDTLLKRGYKTSKTGNRYRSIPFDQAKSPQNLTPKGKQMVELVKKELKARKIPYKKIEYNADGSPKLGKLHVLNLDSPRPSANAKNPQLKGLTIYQHKTLSGAIQRDILTFRTISEKDRGKSWINPGTSPTMIMEDTAKWAQEFFEKEMLPTLLKDV